MEYTMTDIERILGTSEFDKYSEFVLETHRGAENKQVLGFKRLKEVLDSSDNESGTMIIMGKPAVKKPGVFSSKNKEVTNES